MHVHVCVCICVCDMQYYMYSTLRVAVSFETIDFILVVFIVHM